MSKHVRVYHDKRFLARPERTVMENIEGPESNEAVKSEYRLVAFVDAPWSQCFELTNHIDRSWQENQAVVIATESARSTSVGDIIVDQDNVAHMVMGLGFKTVTWK